MLSDLNSNQKAMQVNFYVVRLTKSNTVVAFVFCWLFIFLSKTRAWWFTQLLVRRPGPSLQLSVKHRCEKSKTSKSRIQTCSHSASLCLSLHCPLLGDRCGGWQNTNSHHYLQPQIVITPAVSCSGAGWEDGAGALWRGGSPQTEAASSWLRKQNARAVCKGEIQVERRRWWK